MEKFFKIQLFLVYCGFGIAWVQVQAAAVHFDHRVFLWHIFDKYGQNGSLPVKVSVN